MSAGFPFTCFDAQNYGMRSELCFLQIVIFVFLFVVVHYVLWNVATPPLCFPYDTTIWFLHWEMMVAGINYVPTAFDQAFIMHHRTKQQKKE